MFNYVTISSPDFDMSQIADSGQCFRINTRPSQNWEIIAFDRALMVHQEDHCKFVLECSREEYERLWLNYFDMRRDYGKIKENIRSTGDRYLIDAIESGYGIRILQQDLWEMIVTFLISQQNNIPRIKKTIAKLCEPFKMRFPTPLDLEKYTEKDFLSIGLGYRANYIKSITESVINGELNLSKLQSAPTSEAVKYLQSFLGIGIKVANCIALYGLHRVECFPIDIWINKIISRRYKGNFDTNRFPGYAGIVQQYMYFYERNLEPTA